MSFVKYFLSRLAYHIDRECAREEVYDFYYYGRPKDSMEVEHIISNQWEKFRNNFEDKEEFERLRNMVGGLLLLPKSFNQSYGARDYEYKVEKYYSQNLLAGSLSPDCYDGDPKFSRFIERYNLPFRPHEHFLKEDIRIRHDLYKQLAEQIWSPHILDKELEGM